MAFPKAYSTWRRSGIYAWNILEPSAAQKPPSTSCRSRGISTRRQSIDSRVFRVSDEVRHAVETSRPVVALESTIYTHGYPREETPNLAAHLESVVRLNGAVPATIGILDGVARVGLDADELFRLTSIGAGEEVMKVSRRDLPHIIGLGLAGRRLRGGTTISATILLSQMAGIEICGTAGLGGVHRGGQHSMDVSADLTELGRTGVTVICSGCKNFLDLARTLEYLETQGVCVSTFADGRTNDILDIPSFYSRSSGIPSPSVTRDEEEAAAIIYARRLLNISSGIFLANPISAEYSIPHCELEAVIDTSIEEASQKGYHGSSNTPFVLARMKERAGGLIVRANKAMIESNVKRAAKVAVQLSKVSSS